MTVFISSVDRQDACNWKEDPMYENYKGITKLTTKLGRIELTVKMFHVKKIFIAHMGHQYLRGNYTNEFEAKKIAMAWAYKRLYEACIEAAPRFSQQTFEELNEWIIEEAPL